MFLRDKGRYLLQLSQLKALPTDDGIAQKESIGGKATWVTQDLHIMKQRAALAGPVGFPEEQGIVKGVCFKPLQEPSLFTESHRRPGEVFLRYSGESRNPVFSISLQMSGPRFSPG
jgi:hypothetical protein